MRPGIEETKLTTELIPLETPLVIPLQALLRMLCTVLHAELQRPCTVERPLEMNDLTLFMPPCTTDLIVLQRFATQSPIADQMESQTL